MLFGRREEVLRGGCRHPHVCGGVNGDHLSRHSVFQEPRDVAPDLVGSHLFVLRVNQITQGLDLVPINVHKRRIAESCQDVFEGIRDAV